jgi:hypothetical protein
MFFYNIISIIALILLTVYVCFYIFTIIRLKQNTEWFKYYLKDTFNLEEVHIKGYINHDRAKFIALKLNRKVKTEKTDIKIKQDIDIYFNRGKKGNSYILYA